MLSNLSNRTHLRQATLSLATALLCWTATAQAREHEVIVRNFEFAPADLAVAPGDIVRFVWESGTHTVTSGDNCTFDGIFFDEPITSSNTTYEFVIPDNVNQIPYYCRPHCGFGMTGVLRVDAINFRITLDGDQEVPPVDTAASGSGTASLDTATNTLSWSVTFGDLSSMQSAAHFHGPAAECENAGVQVGLTTGSPLDGSAILSPAQVDDLLNGLWYLNIHTQNFPAGEIRGQVVPTPVSDPIPGGFPVDDLVLEIETVATGLTAPNWGTAAPGVPGRLFVSDQIGTVWNIDPAANTKSVFLDVSSRLVPLGVFGPGSFDERGLLGVAFHPDYQNNGLLYTYTSEPASGSADYSTLPIGVMAQHDTVILEWQVANPADPNSVADPGSARELLRIAQPQFNHNAGCLNFGPDGLLYIALGDGGGADDKDGQSFIGNEIVGHGCIGNGQNTSNPLGAILRIDPLGNNSDNGQYGIPADNPFANTVEAREIFAWGFRNPFRFSFDRLTGDLYTGDVGQNDIEEVNIVTLGGNYGWKHKEGTFFFLDDGNQPGYVTDRPVEVPASLVDPIAEYDHDEGVSVIGGFVYRGNRISPLDGRYVFGEFSASNGGRLLILDPTNTITESSLTANVGLGRSLLGFGEDAIGELYLLTNTTGTPSGNTGEVLRLTLRPGDLTGDGCVDFDDFSDLVNGWGTPAADLNGDQMTDFDDFSIVVNNWNNGCP